MQISIIHRLLGAVADMMETNIPADEKTMLNNVYSLYSDKLSGDKTTQPTNAGDSDSDSDSDADDDTKVGSFVQGLEYSSEDKLVETAHNAILAMSKASKSAMAKKIRVGAKRAAKIWDSLVADGYINEHGNAVPPQSVGKNAGAPEVTADNIESMIDNLPAGSDVLLSAPFSFLVALDEKRRKPYLTGIDITTVLTTDSIANAVKEGADPSMVKTILARTDKSVKSVKDPIAVDNTPKGKEAGKKIAQRVAIIGELGEVLFNHMVRGGFNKTVFEDLTTIAKAVKAGEV